MNAERISHCLGVCFGSSNVSMVLVEKSVITKPDGTVQVRAIIRDVRRKRHHGSPLELFTRSLEELLRVHRLHSVTAVATGRKFRHALDIINIPEPEATQLALQRKLSEYGKIDALISAGGETILVYELDSKGRIKNVHTGNKCASGTGEFFLQQIKRMSITLEEAVEQSRDSGEYRVSGRCSVFCKSDCTHALNKGEPKGNIIAGLCRMMAQKMLDLMVRLPKGRVVIVGGITRNARVLDYLKAHVEELIVPEEATYFEAFGAALHAAFKEGTELHRGSGVEARKVSHFHYLPPLAEAQPLVSFQSVNTARARRNDSCILGLDVGSTTTKAVLIRVRDNAMLGQVYLRTNGDPVQASRDCYAGLAEQADVPVRITGLGVTGSGRNIAGLHALSDGIANEIIAHAKAAAYFSPEVDTILEIGGQDAKYTFLTNGVPTDYAMNEACSAGTGSFLEEAAHECLDISYTDIADIAFLGNHPPNFNDQCSAFISSDIINATQDGFSKEDITAGLVYSICMNYLTRVKGNRQLGNTIFMQGGVCYNRAIPYAMALLLNKPVIVPPFPGLMGAFGVALVVKEKIEKGLLSEKSFSLSELAAREIAYDKPFVCREKGGCDRGCMINILVIDGKKYPFGGACNKYYNLVHQRRIDKSGFDSIRLRQAAVFRSADNSPPPRYAGTVGLNRSFMVNQLYPLFSCFFEKLGYRVVLPDEVTERGRQVMSAPFCYPSEIAHGYFLDLLGKRPDFIFLPHITELYQDKSVSYRKEHQSTCMVVQGESYYLRSTFRNEIRKNGSRLLTPVLNFSQGWESQPTVFADLSKTLGRSAGEGIAAYREAVEKQKRVLKEIKEIGRNLLRELESDRESIAVVIFGRPYNAYAPEANLSIPDKFASMGIRVVPFDALPFEDEHCEQSMYWAMGQMILKAARFVARHPQLFGAFITNFSCGPDAFLLGYIRDIMGRKPSLTLELDSHTADAGITTRIEAFCDIVGYWRRAASQPQKQQEYQGLTVEKIKGRVRVRDADGTLVSLTDPSIRVLIPPMGIHTRALASTLQGAGINAEPLQQNDMEILKKGRNIATCKECIPLVLTAGNLCHYLDTRMQSGERILYFMPEAPGGCRFGQYNVFMRKYLQKRGISNVGLFTLTNEDGYAGMDLRTKINFLKAVVVSDIFTDIRHTLMALAVNRDEALAVWNRQWDSFNEALQQKRDVGGILRRIAAELRSIPLKYGIKDARKVLLVGEIYTRMDSFSLSGLAEKLSEKETILLTAPSLEWLNYVDVLIEEGKLDPQFGLLQKISHSVEKHVKRRIEEDIRRTMMHSGLTDRLPVNTRDIIRYGLHLLRIDLGGDPILSTGAALKEIMHDVHGVILIGPFNCMQSRLSHAILSENMHIRVKEEIERSGLTRRFADIDCLPFLSIETDGNPYPQIIQARLEAFCLQVDRLYAGMRGVAGEKVEGVEPCLVSA